MYIFFYNKHQNYKISMNMTLSSIKNKIPSIVAFLIIINGIIIILTGFYPFLTHYLDGTDLINKPFIASLFQSQNYNIGISSIAYFVLGYFLIVIARGIFHRKRSSWLSAVCILTCVISINFFADQYDMLFYLHVFELFCLISSYSYFIQTKIFFYMSYSHFMIILSFVLSFGYGVFGSYLLRGDFENLHTFLDSIYFTIVTYSTIGYGDIVAKTETARVFVTSMTFFGLASFAAILSYFISTITTRVQKVVKNLKIEGFHMKNHIVIFGLDELTEQVIEKLSIDRASYIVVTESHGNQNLITNSNNQFITGRYNDVKIYDETNLKQAANIYLGLGNDADNILALLSIQDFFEEKKYNKPNIILKINDVNNLAKAKKLGADEVISPVSLATTQILKSITKTSE